MRRCLKGLRLSRKTNQAEKRRHMKARHANDGKKGETWAQHETGRHASVLKRRRLLEDGVGIEPDDDRGSTLYPRHCFL